VVGKWREIGKSATLEFHRDGTFKAVDNQGMVVRGKYSLDERGHLRFEITIPGSPAEVVDAKVTMRSGELTLEFSDHNAVEKYEKEKE